MKTTGVSNIPKLGLLVFLGHPSEEAEWWVNVTYTAAMPSL